MQYKGYSISSSARNAAVNDSSDAASASLPLMVSPSAAVTLHCPSVAASALRPGSSHQLPNIAQHRLRFKRLIVKARIRRDIVGQGLPRL
jgi:hypothetical protein